MAKLLLVGIHLLVGASLAIWGYRKSGIPSPLRSFYFPALLYKVCLGIGLGLIYHFYYLGGDTVNMFQDAVMLARMAIKNPIQYLQALFFDKGLPPHLIYLQQPRALLFVKFISIFGLITGGNYWLTSMYLSLISFFAIWYLVTMLVRYFGHREACMTAFLFYPSAVFWSAGIIKESMAIALICLMVSLMLVWMKSKKRPRQKGILLLCMAVAALLLWKIKYYYAAVLLPVVLAVMILYRMKIKWVGKMLLLGLLLAGFFAVATFLHPNLNFSHLLQALVINHDLIEQASGPGHAIHYQALEPTLAGFLRNIPLALFSGLFRPLPWDGVHWLHFLVGLENSVLLVTVMLALYHVLAGKVRVEEKLLCFATLLYIILLAVLLALSSPNFGTLMRYKSAYLPFLLYLSLTGCQPVIDLIKGSLLRKFQLMKKR